MISHKRYASVEHWTSNNEGLEEFTFFHRRGYWRRAFDMPAVIETYVSSGKGWVDENGQPASSDKVLEITRHIMRSRVLALGAIG
jgi:hypothetical protein